MWTNRFRTHVWTVVLLAAGIALLAVAGFHAYHHDRGILPPPSHRTAARDPGKVAPWMTLRYVSRAYNVPEPVLLRALQLDPPQARGRTLAGIASLKGVETRAVLTRVRGAILEYRDAGRSTPTAPPAP